MAVSPADCNTMVVAFRTVGPYISFDGADSYTQPNDNGTGQQHSDLHALLFDPDDPTTLYVGSDGGLLAEHNVSAGRTVTFDSSFDRQLLDLQLYHVAPSTQVNGLVGVPLQDNGADWNVLAPNGPGVWNQFSDSDGSYGSFVTPVALAPGHDVYVYAENVVNWTAQEWDGAQFGSGSVIPVQTSSTARDPTGISGGPIARVRVPGYANGAGQDMYAVAGNGQNVYGLFANDDGGDLHWETIAIIGAPDNVTAVSTALNGSSAFVGTDQLHIYQLDAPYTGTPTSLTIATPSGAMGSGSITSLSEASSGIAIAGLSIGGNGYVLGWLGQQWTALGGSALPTGLPFSSVLLADLGDLYAITKTTVYASHDFGSTWASVSSGLPAVPEGDELSFVTQPDGTRYLYMSTYGRSLWRTVLP
jgi:hypothetical protein